jgi:hypothetical protein
MYYVCFSICDMCEEPWGHLKDTSRRTPLYCYASLQLQRGEFPFISFIGTPLNVRAAMKGVLGVVRSTL